MEKLVLGRGEGGGKVDDGKIVAKGGGRKEGVGKGVGEVFLVVGEDQKKESLL